MSDTQDTASIAFQYEHLPIWWRCMLVAAATIILCSCSSPAMRSRLAADQSLVHSTTDVALDSEQDGGRTAKAPSPCPLPAGKGYAGCSPLSGSGTPNGPMPEAESANCEAAIAIDPYGPLPGPSDEYLCDGGDFGTPAGVKADRTIVGLEQEDAVGEYTAADGRVFVTPSNRVCIYAPRFAAVRRVVQVVANEQPVFVNAALEATSAARASNALPPISEKQRQGVSVDMGQRPPSLFRQRQQAGGLENLQAAMDAFTSLGAYANLQIIRTGEVSQAEKARLERSMQSAIALTGVQAPQVLFGVKMAQAEVGVRQPGMIYQANGPEHPKLRLLKLASCGSALPGEEIEFTLRFDNVGDQVIDKVTIADNLSTRFDYVPGSAKSSVDADLVTRENDEGSLILRWEIKHAVKPGAGGILRFQVKVR
ncbi:MAG TPA: hypothetical protein VHE81_14950 [Lacipirellulaceae bacterium]|nr:hypothetical protein [Lacipirellulaceae bacterium]